MNQIGPVQAYADIRKLVTAKAFTAAMSFTSWHNRLQMTPTLDLWKALTVAFACEHKPLDQLQFSAAKRFLDREVACAPLTVEACRELAGNLLAYLTPAQ
jgi:hypothetical protein